MDVVGGQGQADPVPHLPAVGGLDHPLKAGHVHDDLVVHPLEGDGSDLPGDVGGVGLHHVDVLRADDHVHRGVGPKALVQAAELVPGELHPVVLQHQAVQDVGLPDKVGHKGVFGLVVNVGGGADLLDHAAVHDHHRVGHGQSLLLVVGDKDEGDPRLLLNLLQLHLHVLAQLQVQGPQGLVQQQDLGLVGQSPGDGHPLLLSPGELPHPSVGEARQVHHGEHPLHRLLHFPLALLFQPHAEGNVVVDV